MRLYLPVIDSWAAASPDAGVSVSVGIQSQREFRAFHLLHFDVESVRCCGVFLPRRVGLRRWHSFEHATPSW